MRWLATPGMDEAKIAAFYDDRLMRSLPAPSLPVDTADDDGHARALVRGTSAHK